MNTYKRHRFPPDIISYAVWLYYRFNLSRRAKRFFKRLLRFHGSEPTQQAQRFITAYAAVSNPFNPGRHLVRAQHYRNLRIGAFEQWSRAVA